MKPFMLRLTQSEGQYARQIYVNMNQVCYIAPNGDDGSILTFACILQDEFAYLAVKETPDQIGSRPEWSQP